MKKAEYFKIHDIFFICTGYFEEKWVPVLTWL